MLVEDGMEKGVEVLIKTCREFGADFDQTVDKVKAGFHFSDEKAVEVVKRYWS